MGLVAQPALIRAILKEKQIKGLPEHVMINPSVRPVFTLAAGVLAMLIALGISGCGKDKSVAPPPAPDVLAMGWYVGDSADDPNGYWFPRRNFIAVGPDKTRHEYFLVGPRVEELEALHQARGGATIRARIEGIDTGARPTSIVDGSQSIEVELIRYELLPS